MCKFVLLIMSAGNVLDASISEPLILIVLYLKWCHWVLWVVYKGIMSADGRSRDCARAFLFCLHASNHQQTS